MDNRGLFVCGTACQVVKNNDTHSTFLIFYEYGTEEQARKNAEDHARTLFPPEENRTFTTTACMIPDAYLMAAAHAALTGEWVEPQL